MVATSFIGMGVMGFPMAGHLAAKGHDVTVYNRSAGKADAWVGKHGGRSASTPREAAHEADIVFVCVGNDDDVRSVIYGEDGAMAGMKAGAILVDHTTASAELARELETGLRDKGLRFLDAPVSGGQAGAENGVLTVMVGGEADTFEAARPVIEAYSRMIGLMGPAGSGQLTKMMNQICIAGLVQGLSEAVHFGQRAGLDISKVVEVISKGAAGSWQMENRHKTMDEGRYDFGFAVEWMRKDLGICLAEAKRNGASLPATALIDQFYAEVEAMGGKRWDTSSLLARLNR
ncbi:NAD(P)-dependent oxidoreductase [Aureimonas phyllosphaerae]|uniref:3-hydroxyisobutyrate dehydrogenase/2-hydroxy-3-oxopropionate reductase n=1 Tax=Aureimonas phyllosphaerae TaxID=1166078 RepID=A0A7W6FU69_9HYPH|nr:NAD(P)-dependent oxidoreductase [Aureimonas phyllosphaerae]MBB3935490.1 3-hydroxyisobutyrate dehydrogenase/2-hydroxy-3-oxopropionate reductase [Aureimonas phyllosphaerae]MBB3959498.1 3-hydroxyisobutyrate dehydrogenase/2-hydroxy-3-oxopropionate reductase [Aureimonas phyllosphaerae]SFF11290.1 3-hydroxyisobutyrate dehydrogenase/2-hydroxy-3-oxopropionate reductase [Aureimonas phyllosphaerae]